MPKKGPNHKEKMAARKAKRAELREYRKKKEEEVKSERKRHFTKEISIILNNNEINNEIKLEHLKYLLTVSELQFSKPGQFSLSPENRKLITDAIDRLDTHRPFYYSSVDDGGRDEVVFKIGDFKEGGRKTKRKKRIKRKKTKKRKKRKKTKKRIKRKLKKRHYK